MKSFSKLVVIALISLLLLPSPSFPSSPSNYDPNGRLVLALGGEVSVLNPILSTDTSSGAVEGVIFTGMTKINEKLEIIPDLAKSWDISKDGKVWLFHLRTDVKWHDGQPFTAKDVVFTFNSIMNPKVNSVRRSDFIIDGQPIKFIAVDQYTVKAVLPKPFAPFLVHSGMGIVPEHLLKGKDINTADLNRHPIGTGPFKFAEWRSGDYVKVVRNDNYYDGKPKLAEILFRVIPDENATLIALEAGEVDEAGIPAKDYSRVKNLKGVNVFEYDALMYVYLGLNLDKPIFKDKRVRQALAYGTDKNQLVSLILKKLGTPAYCPSAPISWAYSDNVEKYPYDPEKAKALLKEAGVENLEFTCLVNQGNKEREKAAIILQQQYKKIGVKMVIRELEWSALLKIINKPTAPKDFDAVIIGWSLGLDPDAYSIWHSSQYPAGFNFIKYSNKRVDRLLEVGRTTMDKAKRKKIYSEMNRLISIDQPYVFLWYPKTVSGVRDRVGGLAKPGPAGLFLNIEKVYVKK